ncbi:MAG: DUF58 domain-containing protein [Chloroflexota bacterium]
MSGRIAFAMALALLGAVLGVPGLIVVAVIVAAYGTLTRLWTRYGLGELRYERRLSSRRALVGDAIDLDITVWNRKPLPLPFLAADDQLTDGLPVRERPDLEADETGRRVLDNAWALAPFERVVRHFHLDAGRRGRYELGPVALRVRDVFGRAATETRLELRDAVSIGPRIVPLAGAARGRAPLGQRRTRTGLFHDPALFGGVRPFASGDSLRTVHWRASARLGSPVAKRFEPAHGSTVVIALDVQTLPGAHWEMAWDDDAFEGLCVAAAAIARESLREGAAVGFAAASFTGTPQRIAWLPPRASRDQSAALNDLLARIGPISSGPLGGLLTWLAHRAPGGATIVLLSARDPRPELPTLRRLARGGHAVEIILLGGAADALAGLRGAGLRATTAVLDPNWRTADALVVAG